MQIVIDIPKGRYEEILSGKPFIIYQNDIREVLKNGKPLPKGHGRLVDADEITDFEGHYITTDAPTIIEADKESEG